MVVIVINLITTKAYVLKKYFFLMNFCAKDFLYAAYHTFIVKMINKIEL